MLWLKKYKKTNFKAGGCILEETTPKGFSKIKTSDKFVAPRKIDSRDMLLTSSHQGGSPHCVGYSTAGYCEFVHWKTKHYPQQIDGDHIYFEAKKLDNSPNVRGTWIKYGIQASINLNLIQGKGKLIPSNMQDIKFALHQYGVCIAGFRITNEWDKVERKTGIISDFGDKAKKRGGHAVLLCGYDSKGIYIQNSWGEEWGLHGFALLKWHQFDKQFKYAMVIE